ncbi:phage major capsid protein, partial [Streptococcus parasanguinis]|nr:phage major capsid protein [Streptococcus parasanguinis]
AEDDATYCKMEQEISDLGKEISRLERQEQLEAELSKPVNTPLTSKPATGKQPEIKTGRASDEYKAGMLKALRSNFKQVSNIL